MFTFMLTKLFQLQKTNCEMKIAMFHTHSNGSMSLYGYNYMFELSVEEH